MKKSLSSSSSSSSPVHVLSVQPEISKPKRTRRTLNHKRPNAGRSSQFRGVTKHRWTGRFEAHLWDRNATNNQMKKGKQVYLGAYDNEMAAARTYDLAALKFWGPDTTLNFDVETYAVEIEAMKKFTRDEYLSSLRRQSSGFSRGQSKFRGVARHHHNGRWEARIGRVYGNKYLYLGTFTTQEEAAMAYDRAAIMYRGLQAVTNFEISNYLPVPHQLLNDYLPAPAPLSPPAPQTPTRVAEPIRPVSPSLTFLTLSTHTNGPQQVIGSSDYISTSELLEPEVQSAAMVDPAMGYDDSWNLCMDALPMPNNPYGNMQFYNASDIGMAVSEDFKVEPMEGTDWFQYLNESDGFQESMAVQGGAGPAGTAEGSSRCSCGCAYPIGYYS